jgi:hypothetical protein
VPMSTTERARIAGRARAEKLSPQRRREIARQGHLASAVSAILARASELSGDDIAQLRTVLSATPQQGARG